MIYIIGTTTLNKKVKRRLETGQYSKEEATFIYMEYLKLKKQREGGTKVAGISMALIWGLLYVLSLQGENNQALSFSEYFLFLILFEGIVYLFIILRLVFLKSRFIVQ